MSLVIAEHELDTDQRYSFHTWFNFQNHFQGNLIPSIIRIIWVYCPISKKNALNHIKNKHLFTQHIYSYIWNGIVKNIMNYKFAKPFLFLDEESTTKSRFQGVNTILSGLCLGLHHRGTKVIRASAPWIINRRLLSVRLNSRLNKASVVSILVFSIIG